LPLLAIIKAIACIKVFDRNPKTDQQGFFVYSKPYKTPRLKVITNGFGIQTTLNYKPLVFCPPMALSVVTDEMTWRAFWMEMFG
jgi:hypothetical protein